MLRVLTRPQIRLWRDCSTSSSPVIATVVVTDRVREAALVEHVRLDGVVAEPVGIAILEIGADNAVLRRAGRIAIGDDEAENGNGAALHQADIAGEERPRVWRIQAVLAVDEVAPAEFEGRGVLQEEVA